MSNPYGQEYWDRMKAQGGERREDYVKRVYDQARYSLKRLEEDGYQVEDMNEGQQFRINGVLDVYPRNQRWHNVETGERGEFTKDQKNLHRWVHETLPLAS